MRDIFHYTSHENWLKMNTGQTYQAMGLHPRRRLYSFTAHQYLELPEKAAESVFYAFLEPMPQSWNVSEFHPGQSMLEDTVRHKGDDVVLLKTRAESTDELYVADMAPHMADDFRNKTRSSKQVNKRVAHEYFNSLTPLLEYQGGYALPEVIGFTPIPLNRLEVVEKLPLFRLINKFRKGTDRPLIMPPRKPRLEDQLKMLDELMPRAGAPSANPFS